MTDRLRRFARSTRGFGRLSVGRRQTCPHPRSRRAAGRRTSPRASSRARMSWLRLGNSLAPWKACACQCLSVCLSQFMRGAACRSSPFVDHPRRSPPPRRRGALACLMHTAAYRTDSADTHRASRSTRSSWAIGAWATTGWATLRRRRRLRRDRLHTQGPRRLGDRHHGRGPSARCLRPSCLAAQSLVRQTLRFISSWD